MSPAPGTAPPGCSATPSAARSPVAAVGSARRPSRSRGGIHRDGLHLQRRHRRGGEQAAAQFQPFAHGAVGGGGLHPVGGRRGRQRAAGQGRRGAAGGHGAAGYKGADPVGGEVHGDSSAVAGGGQALLLDDDRGDEVVDLRVVELLPAQPGGAGQGLPGGAAALRQGAFLGLHRVGGGGLGRDIALGEGQAGIARRRGDGRGAGRGGEELSAGRGNQYPRPRQGDDQRGQQQSGCGQPAPVVCGAAPRTPCPATKHRQSPQPAQRKP